MCLEQNITYEAEIEFTKFYGQELESILDENGEKIFDREKIRWILWGEPIILGLKSFLFYDKHLEPIVQVGEYSIDPSPFGLRISAPASEQQIFQTTQFRNFSLINSITNSMAIHSELILHGEKTYETWLSDNYARVLVIIPAPFIQAIGDRDVVSRDIILPRPELLKFLLDHMTPGLLLTRNSLTDYQTFYQDLKGEK